MASTPLLARNEGSLLAPLGTLAAFARGEAIPDPQCLKSNVLLAPLTLVSQVLDWLHIMPSEDFIVQGFCIGFLSAAVVSSSRNKDRSEFERSVANSIRLAACIVLLIDAEDATHATSDRATAVSVRCQSPSDRALLETTLDLFPQVCISLDLAALKFSTNQLRHTSPALLTTVHSPSPFHMVIWRPSRNV